MLHAIRKHLKLIIVWGILLALLSGGVSLLFPMKYSATSQVLIISRDRSGVDPYTQAKSAETIGQNLAQMMKTTDFYNKVITAPAASFDKNRWTALNDRDRRKMWDQDVQGSMVYGTSLLQVVVYSPTASDALALSNAVTGALTQSGWEYVGGDVAVKSVNDPLVSRFPAKPNFILNTSLGFLTGFLLTCLWVVNYRRHTA
jgi:capsular polysaccharide biosynthesis protein